MPEPPRRMRIQIHLSTAIVLMFVAGGIIWANITPEEVRPGIPPTDIRGIDAYPFTGYGWPAVAWERWRYLKDDPNEATYFVRGYYLTFDIFVALAILFAVWFVSEHLI